MALAMCTAMLPMSVSADFVKTDKGTKYQTSDGTYLKNCFNTIGKKTYYFDKNGFVKTGWMKTDKGYYYFDDNGVMQTGLKQMNNTYYYFYSNGLMCTTSAIVGDYIYNFGSDGKYVSKVNGWIKFTNGSYYCKNGKIQKGLVSLSNNGKTVQYYFNDKGILSTNSKIEYGIYILYTNEKGEVYKTIDNSQNVISKLNTLYEKKSKYENDIREYNYLLEDSEYQQSIVYDSLKDAKTLLQNAKNDKSVLVYGAGGGLSYQADENKIARAQKLVNSYQKVYNDWKKTIKEIKTKVQQLEKQLKETESQIAIIEETLRKAGYTF